MTADLTTQLGTVPLDALMKTLEEQRPTLDDAAVVAIMGRADLAQSAERLTLLDRIVRVLPDGTLAVADQALARALIESLTRDRFQKSQPALKRIWAAAGSPALSELARHGLDKMGERTARQAKEVDAAVKKNALTWSSSGPHWELSRPISALFDLNPASAFERLGRYLAPEVVTTDTGAEAARNVLAILERRRDPLPPDPRWLDAAAMLVDHPRLKVYAKAVLTKAGPDAARAALARAEARTTAPSAAHPHRDSAAVRPPLGEAAPGAAHPHRDAAAVRPPVGEARYLDRYRAGAHEAVWRELQALGENVGDPRVLEEAQAVARETMERVRRNVGKIVARLREHRYKLKSPAWALGKPSAAAAKAIATIEKAAGHPVPLSLRAFWEIVGSVDLTEGNRPYDEGEFLFETLGKEDPLVVCVPKTALEAARAYNRPNEALIPELREAFRIYISPGAGAKYNPDDRTVGDDDPHLVALAGIAADGLVLSRTRAAEPFVEYLRSYLKWGGFAGLKEPRDDPEWPGLAILTSDLEPF